MTKYYSKANDSKLTYVVVEWGKGHAEHKYNYQRKF